MPKRLMIVGLTAVACYVAAVSATVAFGHRHVRPLYDSFAPPTPYRWVDPPRFFAPGNIKPNALSTNIALRTAGSDPVGLATSDGQFVVSLARGAIAARPGATSVAVRIVPQSPKHVPPLPRGLRPNGNVYRVEMTYEPAGIAVSRLARPGTLLVEMPEVGATLFRSLDGTSWSAIPARALAPSQLSLTARFDAPGSYVAATDLPELVGSQKAASNRALVIGIVTASAAIVLFAGGAVLARRRRHNDAGQRADEE